jgi:hypothetical protein
MGTETRRDPATAIAMTDPAGVTTLGVPDPGELESAARAAS